MLGINKEQAAKLKAMTDEMDMVSNTASLGIAETLRQVDIWSAQIKHILKGLKT